MLLKVYPIHGERAEWIQSNRVEPIELVRTLEEAG